MFPNQDAVNRHLMWTDPVMKFIDVSTEPRRIVGVAADIDDENIVPGPAMTVYHPIDQELGGGRLFVHARRPIPTRWSPPITQHHPRDVGRTSRSSARRRSRTSAPKCWRPTG